MFCRSSETAMSYSNARNYPQHPMLAGPTALIPVFSCSSRPSKPSPLSRNSRLARAPLMVPTRASSTCTSVIGRTRISRNTCPLSIICAPPLLIHMRRHSNSKSASFTYLRFCITIYKIENKEREKLKPSVIWDIFFVIICIHQE